MERGFENVTLDEIAHAADVGRVTIFNHFPRKEDLFFDRDEEARDRLRVALRERDPGVAPIEWLRQLVHRWIAEGVPYLEFSETSQRYFKTIESSDTLKARGRAIRDELELMIAEALTECVGDEVVTPEARLAANLQVAIWSTAFVEAHRTFGRTHDTASAEAAFLTVIDRGSIGLKAALADTCFVFLDT
jgi:AcrR family transcriptional regulator